MYERKAGAKSRHIFIIGDVEMGKRDRMDDFCDDGALVKFFERLGNLVLQEDVTLILNGDFFDFLKMDYHGEYPRHITEEISLWKLGQVSLAHPRVFEAMKVFADHTNARIFFVIGNHDADLAWPALQQKLRAVLGGNKRIFFGFYFGENGLRVEHGNLLDPFFIFDEKKPVIEHKGRQILNLPFGSHISTQYLVPIKKKFRNLERLYPRHAVFERYHEFKKAVKRLLFGHGWKIFLVDPLAHASDPTYRVPYGRLLRFIWQNGLRFVHDESFMDLARLIQSYPESRLFVLSHAHVLKDFNLDGRRILITDTWRNEYNILTQKRKDLTYAEILLEDGKIASAELKTFDFHGERRHGGIAKNVEHKTKKERNKQRLLYLPGRTPYRMK